MPVLPPRTSAIDNGKVEKLRDLLEPHLSSAVHVWVQGLSATLIAYDRSAHKMVDTGFPDTKLRAECALRIVEYVVGRAIERSMEVTGNYKELSELVDELKKSPEAQRLIAAGFFNSLLQTQPSESGSPASALATQPSTSGHSNTEDQGKEKPREGETISQSEPKTG